MKKSSKVWIVKIGSQLLVDGGPLLVRSLINDTADLYHRFNIKVIWVSSGAIATAKESIKRLNLEFCNEKKEPTLPEKQALSAIGQPTLMDLYNLALQSRGLMGAQVLLSYSDFDDKAKLKNLSNTILKLLEWGVVPILNENDVISTEEIQFGDNDQLSSMIAIELKVDRLIMLTNVEGLYDKNPEDDRASIIPLVTEINDQVLGLVYASKSSSGRGGMYSKLSAAKNAWEQGIPSTIIHGEMPRILTQLAEGKSLGTSIGRLCKK